MVSSSKFLAAIYLQLRISVILPPLLLVLELLCFHSKLSPLLADVVFLRGPVLLALGLDALERHLPSLSRDSSPMSPQPHLVSYCARTSRLKSSRLEPSRLESFPKILSFQILSFSNPLVSNPLVSNPLVSNPFLKSSRLKSSGLKSSRLESSRLKSSRLEPSSRIQSFPKILS